MITGSNFLRLNFQSPIYICSTLMRLSSKWLPIWTMTLATLRAFQSNWIFPLCLLHLHELIAGLLTSVTPRDILNWFLPKGAMSGRNVLQVRSIYFPFPSWTLTLGITGCTALQSPMCIYQMACLPQLAASALGILGRCSAAAWVEDLREREAISFFFKLPITWHIDSNSCWTQCICVSV